MEVVRVVNGRLEPQGWIQVDDTKSDHCILAWVQKVQHTTNTFSVVSKQMRLDFSRMQVTPETQDIVIVAKWKALQRLKRSGLLMRHLEDHSPSTFTARKEK